MITKSDFLKIDNEVKTSIEGALDRLKEVDKGNYILFLANGEYVDDYAIIPKYSPYTIEYQLDFYRDESRIRFLSEFMTEYYSFASPQINSDDNQYKMNLELMIYTHIWESKMFLKRLYRVAHLVAGKEYDWKIKVPDMGKHDFIRFHIRQIFKEQELEIWEVIKNGFHTSLRNAFAHSEYSFDTMNKHNRINLYNYSGESWELKSITFDEWSKRFAYSALLSYYFLKLTHERRINLISDFGINIFQIKHPNRNGELKLINIIYDSEREVFYFER